jgi:hypothetical protein
MAQLRVLRRSTNLLSLTAELPSNIYAVPLLPISLTSLSISSITGNRTLPVDDIAKWWPSLISLKQLRVEFGNDYDRLNHEPVYDRMFASLHQSTHPSLTSIIFGGQVPQPPWKVILPCIHHIGISVSNVNQLKEWLNVFPQLTSLHLTTYKASEVSTFNILRALLDRSISISTSSNALVEAESTSLSTTSSPPPLFPSTSTTITEVASPSSDASSKPPSSLLLSHIDLRLTLGAPDPKRDGCFAFSQLYSTWDTLSLMSSSLTGLTLDNYIYDMDQWTLITKLTSLTSLRIGHYSTFPRYVRVWSGALHEIFPLMNKPILIGGEIIHILRILKLFPYSHYPTPIASIPTAVAIPTVTATTAPVTTPLSITAAAAIARLERKKQLSLSSSSMTSAPPSMISSSSITSASSYQCEMMDTMMWYNLDMDHINEWINKKGPLATSMTICYRDENHRSSLVKRFDDRRDTPLLLLASSNRVKSISLIAQSIGGAVDQLDWDSFVA